MSKSMKDTRYALFAANYIKQGFQGGGEAAMKVGFAKAGAGVQSSRMLKDPKVKKILADAAGKAMKEALIDASYILKQSVKLHHRCMGEEPILDCNGEKRYKDSDTDEPGELITYPFNAAGAAKALELAGKHKEIQAFKENITVEVSNVEEVLNARIDAVERLRSKTN